MTPDRIFFVPTGLSFVLEVQALVGELLGFACLATFSDHSFERDSGRRAIFLGRLLRNLYNPTSHYLRKRRTLGGSASRRRTCSPLT